jgi:gas vesicle protein
MYYDREPGFPKFMAGMVVGAALGAGVALLTAAGGRKPLRIRVVDEDTLEDTLDEMHSDAQASRRKMRRGVMVTARPERRQRRSRS